MTKFIPRGIIPAMATPTDAEGNINEGALRKLVNHLIDGGVHGLFPVGSQGEFFALTLEQKKKVIATVIDEAGGRVPVYAGTAALTTREAIETTKMARDLGVDAVSILTPFFTNLSQKEVMEYYLAIAEAVPDLPILLYSNPGRTKVPVAVETVKELAAVDNIVGIKDSSGDMSLTAEYIRVTRGMNFHVLAGRDTLIYATLCYGGTGSITATANVDPRIPVEIYEAFMVGDHRRALEAQYRLAPLRLAFELGTFPVVIKEALNMIGIEAGPAIRPVGPMSAENRARLRQVLVEMGAIEG
ncbi:4-hydroxy-tetrahydrodipicolinate synthase [Moorella thermoacetica]|uniref:4-hydroxy-tetrahydrodipicolinate synthase n=2 Tax=Neomoorella thermoacetica TaxID=1525 RepID=A0A1J5JEP8_NEOTH|nr:4-hydroxy-tetrahydrodipicolinate synthase [Moorella thermoacetica]OIQ07701.1 4-hydroxy-tetrahydrodipicolinate synthase [Moorella thermoacetica]